MTAEELLNQMIPPLKPTDSAQKALDWMEKLRLNQLPVVDDTTYKGIITEDMIMDSGNPEQAVQEFRLIASNINAYPSSHFYDLIKLASQHGLQIVPVLDINKQFMGVVSVNETASALARMFASQGPGGILVISMEPKDYSLTEIARLIESNDAKVLSSFFLSEDNSRLAKLTLKLNREDLTRIIATLERHNYTVVAHFQETELLNVDKERLDLLFRYLNI
jgi:acetoin utilization protein AcuB